MVHFRDFLLSLLPQLSGSYSTPASTSASERSSPSWCWFTSRRSTRTSPSSRTFTAPLAGAPGSGSGRSRTLTRVPSSTFARALRRTGGCGWTSWLGLSLVRYETMIVNASSHYFLIVFHILADFFLWIFISRWAVKDTQFDDAQLFISEHPFALFSELLTKITNNVTNWSWAFITCECSLV